MCVRRLHCLCLRVGWYLGLHRRPRRLCVVPNHGHCRLAVQQEWANLRSLGLLRRRVLLRRDRLVLRAVRRWRMWRFRLLFFALLSKYDAQRWGDVRGSRQLLRLRMASGLREGNLLMRCRRLVVFLWKLLPGRRAMMLHTHVPCPLPTVAVSSSSSTVRTAFSSTTESSCLSRFAACAVDGWGRGGRGGLGDSRVWARRPVHEERARGDPAH